MTNHREPCIPQLGTYDPRRPNVVTFTADSPLHAEIMARTLVDTLTREHVQRLRDELEPGGSYDTLRQRLESAEGFHGMRLWLHKPCEHHGGRRLGFEVDGIWYDESLARFLMRLPEIQPGTDHYGLPVARPRLLFWDWPHRRPPVAEHPPCSRPPHAVPGPDASLFEKMDHCIRWSREQYRRSRAQPSLLTLRWDQISRRLPDVWELRAGMRARMPQEVGDAVNELHERRWRICYEQWLRLLVPEPGARGQQLHEQAARRGWSQSQSWDDLYGGPPEDDDRARQLYEGRFPTPSGPQEAAHQEVERRQRMRERRRP